MLRAQNTWRRMVAIAALGCFAFVSTGSPLAAQTFPGRNVPYQEPTSSSFFRFPTIQPVNYASQSGDESAVAPPVADVGGCGCGGGGDCGCNSCDYGCAAARGCDRWYVSIMGGWQQRETVHEASDARTFIEFDGGFSMNAALGYRFDMFRLEAEYSFMNNECTTAGAAGLSSPTVGNVNLKAFMFNVYHDIEIDGWCWKPYVGAGIGIYQSDLNGLNPEFFQTIGGAFATTPINATSNMPFAYQFRVGASRPLGERTEFFCGYRYFHGEELTFASAPFAGPGAPVFNPNGAWTHGVEFGLRVKF
ncbi:MAG: outer membrane beta-barrel protein [Pirellulales bacterium]